LNLNLSKEILNTSVGDVINTEILKEEVFIDDNNK